MKEELYLERMLYAISREIEGEVDLIGVLTECNGIYTFEYKMGGKLPKWYLRIDEFPDYTRKYTGEEVRPFIRRFVPRKGVWGVDKFLEQHNISEYNEWEILKVTGVSNPKLDVFLVENIGAEVIRHE